MSGFGNKDNQNWKAGDTVEVEVEQKGEYLNFTTPKTFQKAGAGFQPQADQLRMERKLDAVLTELQMIKPILNEILSKVKTDDPF